MEEYIISLILQALAAALEQAVKEGIKYVIKKVVDSAGNTITKIVYEYDSDGDGIMDGEQEIYRLDTMIPDLSSGYCLCNRDNEIGLGMPQFEIVDGFEISNLIDTKTVAGNDNGFIVDLDNDGQIDDVLIPLPDFTGDGYNDWGWLVDDDDNGLPDVSPYSPFYPVGSDEYTYIIERQTYTEETIMEKPVDSYSVTEGLLALILIFVGLNFLRGLFTRKDVFR